MRARHRPVFCLQIQASFCAAACAAVFATVAAAAPAGSGEIVAEAGSVHLDSTEVRTLVARLPSTDQSAVAANRDALERLVRSELVRRALLAEAKAKGFEHDPDTIAQFNRMQDELLVRLWMVKQAAVPPGYPSEDDVKTAYEANKQSLAGPQYHIATIFISAPDGSDSAKLAAALRKAADVGGKIAQSDFAQLAQQQSEDSATAARGGDLGVVSEDKMAPGVLAVVRGLNVGAVGGPVKTNQGFYFLKLIDKKPQAVPTLAEAHDRIVAALRNRRANELEQAYLAQLNERLGVTVNQIALAELQHSLR
jgi:parvulin-like peptidyl-prolyl isomerase